MVESKVGAAVVCRNNNQYEQVRLSVKSEVVDAETVAIRKALEYAYDYCKRHRQIKQVIVFSDSQSSIRKLERTDAFSSQQNVIEAHEYAEKLHNINVRTKVEWVPSHSDIQHNEIVDKLAKEATTITDSVENTEYVSHVKRNARATTRVN